MGSGGIIGLIPLWASELESSALILWEEWETPLA